MEADASAAIRRETGASSSARWGDGVARGPGLTGRRGPPLAAADDNGADTRRDAASAVGDPGDRSGARATAGAESARARFGGRGNAAGFAAQDRWCFARVFQCANVSPQCAQFPLHALDALAGLPSGLGIF